MMLATRKSLGLPELDLKNKDNGMFRFLNGYIVGLAMPAPNLEEVRMDPDDLSDELTGPDIHWELLNNAPDHGLKSLKVLELRRDETDEDLEMLGCGSANRLLLAAPGYRFSTSATSPGFSGTWRPWPTCAA